MFDGGRGEDRPIALTLYTDSYAIRGTIRTAQRWVADVLNDAGPDFLLLADAVLDEYGSRAPAVRAAYAQVNLDAVLFALAGNPAEAGSEPPRSGLSEQAMISIPPFRIVGLVQLPPGRGLSDPLIDVAGRFVPVTDAAYWSERLGEARQVASMIAVNRSRAQILAPHREVDPWEGLGRGSEGLPGGAPDAIGEVPVDAASTSTAPGIQDPWAGTPPADQPRPPAADRWRDTPAGDLPEPGAGAGNPWGGPGGDPWGAGRPRRDDELIG